MDLGTLIGMAGGTIIVLIAIALGGDFASFVDLPSLLIVVGGGTMATLLRFNVNEVLGAVRIGILVTFGEATSSPHELITQMEKLARIARKQGLVALQNVEISDRFLKRGIQLCADGLAFDLIKDALTRERDLFIEHLEESERVFRALGDAAPAFGLIGTLVGLVQMLSHMEDPAAIGPAMAVALLTTLYGALIANLIAIPVADKMAAKLASEYLRKSLVIEGTLHIQNRTNPEIMVDFLNAYLPEHRRGKEVAA